MLENVLSHLKNWFLIPDGVHGGTYKILNGYIELPFLQDGQYYRICGSIFNDGLHKYGDTDDILTDEEFTGTIWALAIPKAVIDLAENIAEWQKKNGEASKNPLASESFGGYSYSKATDAATGGAVTWQSAFRVELNQWRKARENSPVKPSRYWGGWNEPS